MKFPQPESRGQVKSLQLPEDYTAPVDSICRLYIQRFLFYLENFQPVGLLTTQISSISSQGLAALHFLSPYWEAPVS